MHFEFNAGFHPQQLPQEITRPQIKTSYGLPPPMIDLLVRGRIKKDLIAILSNWRHSGFQVFCGQRIFPQDETAMENLARYIIRASFSQKRMQYLAEP